MIAAMVVSVIAVLATATLVGAAARWEVPADASPPGGSRRDRRR